MCGINGILAPGKGGSYTREILGMNKSLLHRGPDAESTWHDNDIQLGHRRLSIIDLSGAGTQPMVSANERYVLTYNGEIYNFREIKKQLPEYPYKSQTDSEVILAAFQEWGINCVHRFNGMFAFAIWDRDVKKLYLIRDRLGIKPLYYTIGEKILFSSEIRAILNSSLVPRKLNSRSVIDYLRYQTVQTPETIIEGIKMLESGHYLEISLTNDTQERLHVKNACYWSPEKPTISISPAGKSKDEIQKDIRSLLHASVERRLISDVPFGAFLSGGIDSSIVVGLMSEIQQQPVQTFSVTFEEDLYSEAGYAEKIAKRFKTQHQEIRLHPRAFLQMLPNALEDMDHPSADGMNTWVISKVTKEAGITMAFSGLGGDELFGGYELFKRVYYLNQFSNIAKVPFGKKLISSVLNLQKQNIVVSKIKEILALPSWDIKHTYPLMREALNKEIANDIIRLPELVSGGFNKVNPIVSLHESLSRKDFPNLYSKVTIAEMNTYLQNVLLRDTDQMSMAHALEIRVPFLDFEFVEYILQIETKHKKSKIPKQLLVDSFPEFLPREIYNRKKMGFVFPWENWMRNELREFCDGYIQKLERTGIFNMQGLLNLWNRFLKGDPMINWSRIWLLVVLSKWLEDNSVSS